ncbi:hypothetical protein ACHQM5_012084 [Ranunculus cassubicifolius]
MGACASKPRDLEFPAAQLPGEKPAAPEPAVETPAEETVQAEEKKNEGVENQKVEEPLVDLSEPTPNEESKSEGDVSAPVVADLVSAVGASDTLNADQTESTKVAEIEIETKEDAPKETKEPEVKAEILDEKKDTTPPIAST